MTVIRLIRSVKKPIVILMPILLALIVSCDAEEVRSAKSNVWSGVVEDKDDGPIKTELSISSGAYTLHYGVPRSCRLQGEEVSADTKMIILRFRESSGGFCDRLYQGRMTIDTSQQNKWSALVERKPVGFEERFSLQKEH